MNENITLILLGISQGITELLPISSSAHNQILEKVLKTNISLEQELVLNLGSVLALLIFFRKKIFETIKNKKLVILILLSLILPLAVGISGLGDIMERFSASTYVISFMLVFVGILMYLSDKFETKIKLSNISKPQALLLGLVESIAFLKGTSRSGITISYLRKLGLSREGAVEFSFLAGLPLLTSASLLGTYKVVNNGVVFSESLPLILGFVSSFVFSLISIKFLMKFVKTNSLKVFVIYRFVLAIFLLIFFR